MGDVWFMQISERATTGLPVMTDGTARVRQETDNRASQTRYAHFVAILTVNLLDNLECANPGRETWGRVPIEPNVVRECAGFDRPGVIGARILVNRGIGRPHFGAHLIERESLDAVAAAEAIDRDLRVAAVKLEGE